MAPISAKACPKRAAKGEVRAAATPAAATAARAPASVTTAAAITGHGHMKSASATAPAAAALAAADRVPVVMQYHAVARDHDAVPAVTSRASRAPHNTAASTAPAAAPPAAGRPFNVVIGRIGRRDIQGGNAIPAVPAPAAIGSPANAADASLANDQRARSGMRGHAERDQGQAKEKPERDAARFVDLSRGRMCVSQRQARIRVHLWFILGSGFTRGFTKTMAPGASGCTRRNRLLEVLRTWNTGLAGCALNSD
ncbi:hypothetical protein [Achromobacter animicus]|uniref:hypothetical protein n=1 Tax=Achromobacter animicus TaxID=1389935 RepID=UPI0015827019|nr:hypothetical protein [Achromobacter animicus]